MQTYDYICIASICCACISILGGIFVITCLVYFRKLYVGTFWRILFVMSIADILAEICMLWGGTRHLGHFTFGCTLQAYFMVTLLNISNTYIFILSINIYRMVKNLLDWSRCSELVINVGAWAAVSGLCLCPMFGVGGITYQESKLWCTLHGGDKPYLRFLFSYFYVWFLMITILAIRITSWCKYSKDDETLECLDLSNNVHKEKVFRQLFWYPISWLILYIPCTLNRIIEISYGTVLALEALEATVLPLQGAVNATVFIITSGLYSDLKLFVKMQGRYRPGYQYDSLNSKY